MGGQLLYRAALATFSIVGSLSAVAAVAPSDQFLNWGGTLSIGMLLFMKYWFDNITGH